MKTSLGALLALLAGCAAVPADVPGTGSGAQYAPFVDMRDLDAVAYARDLSECRRSGAAAAARPERAIMICMTGRGYRTLDQAPEPATVKLLPVVSPVMEVGVLPALQAQAIGRPVGPPSQRLAGGRDLVQAERYVQERSCPSKPQARLTEKGPGFETYSVACSSGETLTVRCEFGNCRATR